MPFKPKKKTDIPTVLTVTNTKITVDCYYTILELLRKTFRYKSSNVETIKTKTVKKLRYEMRSMTDLEEIANHERRLDYIDKWDGYTQLFFKNRIGTGHLESIELLLIENNEPYTLIDKRIKAPNVELGFVENVLVPRQEQKEAMEEIRRADYQGLLQLATGFGKTIMAMLMIKELKTRTIVITNLKVITKQWSDTIQKYFNLTPYYFKTSSAIMFKNSKDENVILLGSMPFLSNVFTMKNREHDIELYYRNKEIKEFIKEVGFLIYDEVQDAGTRKAYSLLNKIPAYYKVGLSATIHSRTDNKDFLYINYFGNVVYEYGIESMIEDGSRVPVDIYFMICKEYPKKRDYDEYHELYKNLIVLNKHRNQLIIDKVEALRKIGDRQILIFVKYTIHGEYFAEKIPDTVYLQGATPDNKREEIKQKFLNMEMDVIVVNSKLASKGYSLENVNTIFLMDDSTVNGTIQSMGRIFHSKEKDLELYDVYDTITPFKTHSKHRYSIYRNNAGKIKNKKELREEYAHFGL